METQHYKPGDDFILRVKCSTFWVRTTATMMGIWPHAYVSVRAHWYRRLYYFMLLMHWFNTYLQLEFFFRNLGHLNLIVQGLCSFCSICTTGIKAMRMHAYEHEILHIWKTIEEATFLKSIRFLRTGDSKIIFSRIDDYIGQQWKEVNINLRFYSLVVGAVASIYSIIPVCSNLYYQLQGSDFNRSFVYNTYYPFLEYHKRRSPLFEVLFCSESLSGFTTWAGVVAFDGLYVVLVLYATSLVRLLGDIMQETTNPALSDSERIFFLHECLLQHTKTIKLIEKINELFSPVLLVQLFTSTSIICVIAFAASFSADEGESQKALMVLYLIAAIYQLFQFCWYGQRLQNESSRLPIAVYNAQWEFCAQEFKSSYQILLMYSQRPIVMRAWSFSAMSLETFSTIIRSAASYFTVLQTLAEQ